MSIQVYRKRPIEIPTLRWTGNNLDEMVEFTGRMFHAVDVSDRTDDPDITGEVYDKLHSTWVGVKTGQSVVRGVVGELYPIDPEVLTQTYDYIRTEE